jgi:hypothetical protein
MSLLVASDSLAHEVDSEATATTAQQRASMLLPLLMKDWNTSRSYLHKT